MFESSDEEIDKVIENLKRFNIVKIYPGHCTGNKAIEKLLKEFEGEKLYSGKIIEV